MLEGYCPNLTGPGALVHRAAQVRGPPSSRSRAGAGGLSPGASSAAPDPWRGHRATLLRGGSGHWRNVAVGEEGSWVQGLCAGAWSAHGPYGQKSKGLTNSSQLWLFS